MPKNLILIGYRATGKTTIARRLGELLQRNVVDTDRLIEQKAQKTIAEIFAEDGETAFRDLESECLSGVLQNNLNNALQNNLHDTLENNSSDALQDESNNALQENSNDVLQKNSNDALQNDMFILSTGGGVPLREKNRELLRRFGKTVWLKASPETIFARMSGDPATEKTRPQLTNLPPLEEIRRVLEQRTPLYHEIADLEIDTEQLSPEKIAVQIAEWVKKM